MADFLLEYRLSYFYQQVRDYLIQDYGHNQTR